MSKTNKSRQQSRQQTSSQSFNKTPTLEFGRSEKPLVSFRQEQDHERTQTADSDNRFNSNRVKSNESENDCQLPVTVGRVASPMNNMINSRAKRGFRTSGGNKGIFSSSGFSRAEFAQTNGIMNTRVSRTSQGARNRNITMMNSCPDPRQASSSGMNQFSDQGPLFSLMKSPASQYSMPEQSQKIVQKFALQQPWLGPKNDRLTQNIQFYRLTHSVRTNAKADQIDLQQLGQLPDHYLSFYSNRVGGEQIHELVGRQQGSNTVKSHLSQLRQLKHDIFTKQNGRLEDAIKSKDNECSVKISRRQATQISQMHNENEPSFEEKVELENEMKQERMKNRVHKKFDDLEGKIYTNTVKWSEQKDRYTKKRDRMLLEHGEADRRRKEERRKIKNDFAYLMNPDAAAQKFKQSLAAKFKKRNKPQPPPSPIRSEGTKEDGTVSTSKPTIRNGASLSTKSQKVTDTVVSNTMNSISGTEGANTINSKPDGSLRNVFATKVDLKNNTNSKQYHPESSMNVIGAVDTRIFGKRSQGGTIESETKVKEVKFKGSKKQSMN